MPTVTPQRFTSSSARHRIGILSTYPPKLCGLATFAAALEADLARAGHRVDIVRIDDGDPDGRSTSPSSYQSTAATLVNGDRASVANAADALSRCDIAVVQHEYGIYGGPDGAEVIELLAALAVPTIVVLHTVPLQPTHHQRLVLDAVCDLADRVVVMSDTARRRLVTTFSVDEASVVTIPHGAATPSPTRQNDRSVYAQTGTQTGTQTNPGDPQLLTWGLLGPGKGIEHAIDALSRLSDLQHRPRYTIAGVTHPKVFARHGDAYRHSLMQRARTTQVSGIVSFDDTYRDLAALTRFVASAWAVVLPYDSRDQVTSGVLVDAIAAGRPVIASPFPHAVELLSSGAGILVPHEDPVALANAIRLLVSDGDAYASMAAEARRIAPSLSWTAVAAQYVALTNGLVPAREFAQIAGTIAV